ncbi:uncharacterized protein LOC108674116 [Hyalella azteca]|uniref:Uncharacterized protein LOC108674116 n=1 Tax=Hyalella azteca TaxID=294128 RepID=A0A8B7NUX1_HYAAZ|nr:uncharacterized protein LOC108674116 [Hyalella azteca]
MPDISIFRSYSGFAKIAQLLSLTVAMAVFFSLHKIHYSEIDKTYYVTAITVSAFLQTSFLLIVYVFGGIAIQKTLYEVIVNSFYSLALLVSAILLFTMAGRDDGSVASGIFNLFAMVAYGADVYFALVNMGAFNIDLSNLPTSGANRV